MPRRVFIASRKQENIEQITERCLIAPKNLASRNELRETENIGAREVDVLRNHLFFMPRGVMARIRGGGVTPSSGQSEGGHEETGVQEGGCLILQFQKSRKVKGE